MKILISILMGVVMLGIASTQSLRAQSEEEPIVVLLVDPEEQPESKNPESPQQPEKVPTLEDLIEEARRDQTTLNEYQERVLEKVKIEQSRFGELLSEFMTVDFNPEDPKSNPDFVRIVEEIVKLVFKAPSHRDFYSRIYLINRLWLENQDQKPRFDFLDKALRDESLRVDSRNRKIRQALIGVTTVAGLGIGGYLGYKAAFGIVKVAANEAGLASVSKMALRGGIIVVFATTGAAAGAFTGLFAGDLILSNSRELLDPIDDDQNLTELLEYIDDL